MKRIPIWIDTDPGVDDAAAILVAHRSPALQIVGISTLAGNAPLGVTTHNALALCAFLGADYPVYRGAAQPWLRPYLCGADFHGADGMGGYRLPEPTHEAEKLPMWDALHAAAEASEEPLTVVTLGPLTNLATAFAKYPDLPQKLDRVVMMGGAAVGGNRTPCAEYNIFADPDAALAVFRSGARLVMCGLDVTNDAWLTGDELEAIGRQGRLGSLLCESSRSILKKNLETGHPGWCIHDTVPVWYLLHPEWFTAREAGVYVETRSELTRGKTVTDLFSDKKFPAKNATVVLSIDRERFADAMREIFTAD